MNTFLIIGGTSGIGLELTKILSSKGNRVIVLSREKRNIDNLANIEFYRYDVTGSDSLPQIDRPIHGLAYCPGSINLKPFKTLRIEDYQKDFEVIFLAQ